MFTAQSRFDQRHGVVSQQRQAKGKQRRARQRLVAGGTSLASRVHRPPVVSARGKDDANRRPQRRGRVGMGSHKGDSGVAIQRGRR